jgi:hypothetical protein
MARRHPTAAWMLLLVPVIAGCATTTAKSPTAAQTPEQPAYLNGISTEYSARIDQLADRSDPSAAQKMPGAVVARDKAVTVVASLFRTGNYYTLDLIVHNRGETQVEIGRANLQLIDNTGKLLRSVEDWKGAQNHGLRATRRTRDTQPTTDELALAAARDTSPGVGTALGQSQIKPGVGDLNSGVGGGVTTPGPMPDTPAPEMRLTQTTRAVEGANLPDVLPVEPGASLPYWGYWSSGNVTVTYPLTAAVVVGNRRMIFRFQQ